MVSVLQKKLKISRDVLFQEVSGEAVLLDLASERYFGLDEVGTRVWQLIEECDGDLLQVFDTMAAEYAVEPKTLERDLIDLTIRFQENGLVEVVAQDSQED